MKKEDLMKLAYVELAKRIKFRGEKPYWVNYPGSSKKRKGNLAGTLLFGYRLIGITIKKNPIRIRAHNLHWFMVYGYIPIQLDHIDINPDNNNIKNLRECTESQNKRNQRKRKGCSSKYKGVTASRGKWQASIRVDGVKRFLGRFVNERDAAKAYNQGAEKYNLLEYIVINEVD